MAGVNFSVREAFRVVPKPSLNEAPASMVSAYETKECRRQFRFRRTADSLTFFLTFFERKLIFSNRTTDLHCLFTGPTTQLLRYQRLDRGGMGNLFKPDVTIWLLN